MSTKILDTKLCAPPLRQNLVPRPSLVRRLDEGRQGRLVLVSAPAGFGKSTVVSEWVAGCARREPEVRAAWLTLDGEDGDSSRFLIYVVAALRTAAPDLSPGVVGVFQASQQPAPESMLTALLNEIASLPYELVLVLDDYHLVDTDRVDEVLTFMLEHLPPQLHVVIATREDPRLPLARWRARGQLVELRAADLRFSASEATEFLNRALELELPAEDVVALEARTEGWIAGLQLAALSLRGRLGASAFIRAFTGSNRFVLDFLVEEVLNRQPQHVRSFLLQTAVLDRLCGDLCDAVTGRADGGEMLERLERANLFVVPLDDDRSWYRYHHLFADALQAHLLRERPDPRPALHRRASEWFEETGSRSEAIPHALRSEDVGWAAALIERAGSMTEDVSQSARWLAWARALPEEVIGSRPVLSVRFAWALLGRGELDAAEARLRDVERLLEPGPGGPADALDESELRSLLATMAVARAYICHSVGDVPGTVKHAQRVLELLPEGGHPRHQQAVALIGMTYWAGGDLRAADRVFTDYVAVLRAAGNIPDAISANSVLPDIRVALGRLRDAVGAVEQLLRFVVDQGEPLLPAAADLYRGLGELDLERGDLTAAAQHLARSRELGEQAAAPVWRYRWAVAQARLKEAQGDLEGALDLLDQAERLFVRTPLPDVRPLAALRARIWAAQGRMTEVSDWMRGQVISDADELSYLHEFEHITLAGLLILGCGGDRVEGTVQDGLGLLERLVRAAEAGGRIGSAIEILILQALALEALNDRSSALPLLERALSLAEPEGYVGVFMNQGPPMIRLLQAAASGAVAPATASRLLAAVPAGVRDGSGISRSEASESLSSREREVLQLLAAGLTNREIAARLYLSLYTVKAHARSINDKLGAHSRTQAVARGRQLGLLPLR